MFFGYRGGKVLVEKNMSQLTSFSEVLATSSRRDSLATRHDVGSQCWCLTHCYDCPSTPHDSLQNSRSMSQTWQWSIPYKWRFIAGKIIEFPIGYVQLLCLMTPQGIYHFIVDDIPLNIPFILYNTYIYPIIDGHNHQEWDITINNRLVGGLEHLDYFSNHIGNAIIPTDELIFFRGVGIPPTSRRYPLVF